MPSSVIEFMRFGAPDRDALERDIGNMRAKFATAVQSGQALAIVEAAADLCSMLTTARMEVEAARILQENSHYADAFAQHEPAAWFWNAYATSLQYCGRRAEAELYFAKCIALAKSSGWRRLEALALHHLGRYLVEESRFAEAESRISEALAIRIELNEPRQESSRRALAELAAVRNRRVNREKPDA